MKFTDEELSRIITAHENDVLVIGGDAGLGYPACLMQAAKLEYFSGETYDLFPNEAEWFDKFYDSKWTTKEFIQKLTEQGLI